MKGDADLQTARIRAVPSPAMPVDRLVVGKPVAEAAALLPRVFNLCRAAQEIAATKALGLPSNGADATAEIARDHLLKLFVVWPKLFGIAPGLKPQMLSDPDTAISALFGSAGLPQGAETMQDFLLSDFGVAPLLRRIASDFGPGEAVADGLPFVTAQSAFEHRPVENSPAGRRRREPALIWVEDRHGRGPLWRTLGRAIDLALILRGDAPALQSPAPGTALVHATRGLYAVRAEIADGHVTAFHRVTPTDHMTAANGVLDQSLASLPADRANLAPLVLDILDPCSPVRLVEAHDA